MSSSGTIKINIMQKVINLLNRRVNKLNKRKKEVLLIMDEPELQFDYIFAKSEVDNIDLELKELREACKILIV